MLPNRPGSLPPIQRNRCLKTLVAVFVLTFFMSSRSQRRKQGVIPENTLAVDFDFIVGLCCRLALASNLCSIDSLTNLGNMRVTSSAFS